MDIKSEKLERINKAKRLALQSAARVRSLAKQRGASALAKEAGLSPQNIQNIIDNENANIGNVVLFALIANVKDFDESYYLKGIVSENTQKNPPTDFEIENERLKKENEELKKIISLKEVEFEKEKMVAEDMKKDKEAYRKMLTDKLGSFRAGGYHQEARRMTVVIRRKRKAPFVKR